MPKSIRENCTAFNAPCVKASQLFNHIQERAHAQEHRINKGTDDAPRDLINPMPYEYGKTFAYVYSYSIGTYSFPSYGGGVAFASPYGWSPQGDLINTVTDVSSIRGYVEFSTVAQYMTDNGYVHANRIFANPSNGTANYDQLGLYDLTTKIPINDSEQFSNYVVPKVTWLVKGTDGNLAPLNKAFSPMFWITARQNNYADPTTLLGDPFIQLKVNTLARGELVYFSLSIPHLSGVKTDYNFRERVLYSGYTKCSWGNYNDDTTRRITVYGNDPAVVPWVTFSASKTAPTATTSTLYKVTSTSGLGIPAVNLGVGTASATNIFPAYVDEESFIELCKDFGIFVTTDLNEASEYTPTDDVKINPDEPYDPIPNYPDNSTDTTPITPATITPSTFGQACIYNPATLKEFLLWVCDSTVDIGNWARLFANPADVITGINLYNLDIVRHDAAHVQRNAQTNILGVATNIPNYSILGGYNNIVDGGTLHLQAYYGNYADFTSMTYQMFIPFVGFTTLRACDVVNKTLHLYYAVDFATGSAVAFVNSDDKLIYTSPCTVAGKIPLSTSDRNSQMINNTLSVLGGLSGLLGGIASGNVGGGVGALMGGLGGLQMQTNYANKGSLSAVNIYSLLPAFVERTRYDLFFPSDDQQYLGAKYQSAAGAPSTVFDTLVNCANAGGFVQSDVVYITSGTATETEKAEIAALIKSGIYL